MRVDLELAPKQKRAAGERCCDPVVYPDVERDEALRMAKVAKAHSATRYKDACCGSSEPSCGCAEHGRVGLDETQLVNEQGEASTRARNPRG